MEKKRIIWADALKGWLMVLVIIGHAIQTVLKNGCFNEHVFNIIYSFHMPAFMAVSGWFAYKHNVVEYLMVCKRRCYQLLIPYLSWSLLMWLIGRRTLDGLFLIVIDPDYYAWFLWVLFLICCIFTLCQWISNFLKIDELVPIIITCVTLIVVMVCLEFRMFGFQFLAYYFLFYTFGYCIHRFQTLQFNKNIVLAILGLIWFFMAWFWKMHELPSWMPTIPFLPSSLLQYVYRGLTAILAILVLFGLAPKILNNETRLNNFIKRIGEVSLGFYVVHIIIIGYIAKAITIILPTCNIGGIISINFIVTFLLSVIIVELLNKNKWTARYLLGKL